jgi:hypothetical protein
MSNIQFSISYNGRPSAVTVLGKDDYMVQVTYKPLQIRLKRDEKGEGRWIEVDTEQETYLANEIGGLIEAQLNVMQEM